MYRVERQIYQVFLVLQQYEEVGKIIAQLHFIGKIGTIKKLTPAKSLESLEQLDRTTKGDYDIYGPVNYRKKHARCILKSTI